MSKNCKNCEHYSNNKDNVFGHLDYYLETCEKHNFVIAEQDIYKKTEAHYICNDYKETLNSKILDNVKTKIGFKKL